MRSHKGKPRNTTIMSILREIPNEGIDAYNLASRLRRTGTHAGNGIQKQLSKMVKARLLRKEPSPVERQGPGRPLMLYFLTPQSAARLTLSHMEERLDQLRSQLDLGDL